MKKADAILYFGTRAAIAKELGISRAAVSRWGELIPPAPAALLEKLSNGALRFDPKAYTKRCGPRLATEISSQDRAA